MKKFTTLVIASLLMGVFAKAQYVDIPDSNFRAWIQGVWPAGFNAAGQMDTTYSGFVNSTVIPLMVNYSHRNLLKPIHNLTGIQYFKSLTFLEINYSRLDTIPAFPQSLGTIILEYDTMSYLPRLPIGLKSLELKGSNLTCLPTIPNSLLRLDLDSNIACLPNYNTYINFSSTGLPVCSSSSTCGASDNNFVNIPDTNFGKYLTAQLPSCLYEDSNNLYWMDTTCAGVLATDSLTTYYNLLGGVEKDTMRLEGLQYFKNLKFLYLEPMLHVSTAVIDSNVLPNGLRTLECGGLGNVIFNTSKLPDSLVNFTDNSCSQVSGSNVVFSSGFKNFNFGGTRSTDTWINGNTYPNNMDSFVVGYLMNYSPLANLPSNLKTFQLNSCWGVTDFSYMNLPAGLQNLSFTDANRNIDTNAINLPKLPATLKTLSLNGTKTYCLPQLPDSLQTLDITGASVSCISKLPNNYLLVTPITPLCNATNNPNGCSFTSANYVNIPDTNFAQYLITQIPSCLYKDSANKYWMDTTCNGVNSLNTISCGNKNIADLTGVSYFKNLDTLNCNNNLLTTLPSLPNTIKVIYATYNQFISLPTLPDSLNVLLCGKSKLTSLPSLPANLGYLSCEYNQLTSLPQIPNSVGIFLCQNNQLTSIPNIPSSIGIFTCDNNQLTSLPAFPATDSTKGHNFFFSATGNKNLTCLPKLPNNFRAVYLDSTGINCLPNALDSATITPAGLTVCSGTSPCALNNNYVNIPDSNFGKYLIGQLPGCLYKDSANKYWMDTTCNGVLNLDSLSCSNASIQDLTGIQYFKSLTLLNCNNNNITSLTNLPNTLLYLSCGSNQFSVLPTLPNSLLSLDCSNNPLQYLLSLPNSLQSLNCSACHLPGLPTMPANLVSLDCSDNSFLAHQGFPNTILPNTIKYLNCSGDGIVYLNSVTLPTSLRVLNCSGNGINFFPILPDSLEVLNCNNNSIITFPQLPNSLQTLLCNNANIYFLTPLSKSLQTLDCSNNRLSTIPSLDSLNQLKTLNCQGNNLTCLPKLPYSLDSLNISSTSINCIPNYTGGVTLASTGLPVCASTSPCFVSNPYVNIPDSNFGKYLISQIPSCLYKDSTNKYWMDTTCSGVLNLTSISLFGYGIKDLTGIQYFKNLSTLGCQKNQLTSLPTLPSSLVQLFCDENQLTSLPTLPDSLQMLMCQNNLITTLPSLPNSLQVLYCANNSITSLPILPNSLQVLMCAHNLITTLPSLPSSLYDLSCFSNPNLHCLPVLPNSLNYLYVANTEIQCIPNSVIGLGIYDTSNANNVNGNVLNLPLCAPSNNANQCKAYPTVMGKVFADNNKNGIKDSDENYIPYIPVSLNTGEVVYTNSAGYYDLSTNDTGSFSLTVTAPRFYKAVPDSVNFSFSANSSLLTLSDIALQPTVSVDSLDINIYNWQTPTPGRPFAYSVAYRNLGTVPEPVTATFTFDTAKLQFDSTSIPNATVSGNTIVWRDTVQPNYFDSRFNNGYRYPNLFFKVLPSAHFGDSLTASALIVSPKTADSAFNTLIVKGSYDPNSKEATPQLSTTQVADGQGIDYRIHFQNVGNTTASNVVVADTLSPLLTQGILEMKGTSANADIILDRNILYFQFHNINLVDSGTNQLLSNGFVNFRVTPISSVTEGTVINNTASIYFDYNSPTLTNTASTLIKNNPLPVSIVNYKAHQVGDNRQIENDWTTANELNTAYYNVQRSVDGIHFSTIGKVTARGIGTGSYHFIDNAPVNGINYYRVQSVDKNGAITFSKVVSVQLTVNSNQIAVYPSPAKDVITLKVSHIASVQVIDNLGRFVRVETLQDATNPTLSVNSLPAGVYHLRVQTTDGQVSGVGFVKE